MKTQCTDRVLHALFAVSSFLWKMLFLEELLGICTLCFINTGYYDMTGLYVNVLVMVMMVTATTVVVVMKDIEAMAENTNCVRKKWWWNELVFFTLMIMFVNRLCFSSNKWSTWPKINYYELGFCYILKSLFKLNDLLFI